MNNGHLDVELVPIDERAAQQLKEIRLEALGDSPDAYGSTLRDELRIRDREWERMAREGNYVLAFQGSRPVAMASGGRHEAYRECRWLYALYVTPELRGTGVAANLVRHVARWARGQGVETLGLHVTETMGRARAFYRSMGFEEDGGSEFMIRDRRLKLLVMTTNVRLNEQLQ